MSAHTEIILKIITEQGPLEQEKKHVERQLAEKRASGRFRDNKDSILELNKNLMRIIKRLSILHKAEVLATKKELEEINGGTYSITLNDVQEVGGTEEELNELAGLLSGVTMTGGRCGKSRKAGRSGKTRKGRK